MSSERDKTKRVGRWCLQLSSLENEVAGYLGFFLNGKFFILYAKMNRRNDSRLATINRVVHIVSRSEIHVLSIVPSRGDVTHYSREANASLKRLICILYKLFYDRKSLKVWRKIIRIPITWCTNSYNCRLGCFWAQVCSAISADDRTA